MERVFSRCALGALAAVLLAGCFEEDLPQKDLDGQLVVPAELMPDARDIGMAFVGIFEGFDPEQLGYHKVDGMQA